MGAYIPETMKNFNNWVVWSKEDNKKIPYDPRTQKRANPTLPCCNYEEAVFCCKYAGYDGIGFTFTKDCNLTFIDLDGCIDEYGNESELAIEMQELFKDCYIELSQSGRGLHIVCIGNVTRALKTPEIELYSSGRYMAMTGNNMTTNEPQEAQKRLDYIYNRFSVKKIERKQEMNPQKYIYTNNINADAVIKIIKNSTQGEKWEKLHSGNIKEYPSRSEAMLAYIAITNYFSGGNIELIKEVFAESQFPEADKKYKNDYYINLAINKAQETATGSKRKKRINTKIIDIYEEPRKGRRKV